MKSKHKKLLLIFAVGALIALAGCNEVQDNNKEGAKELSDTTGTEVDIEGIGETSLYEMAVTEANQKALVEAQPPFQMEGSLERENLIERYKYLNDENNVHHVYMLSHDGKVVNYEVAQGKVSSVNSKLTNDKQIVKVPEPKWDNDGGGAGGNGVNYKVVESPQMDGSYGSNGDAIFFFTTDGHYVEYNGIYVVSEEPKEITTEVTLIEEAGSENGTDN